MYHILNPFYLDTLTVTLGYLPLMIGLAYYCVKLAFRLIGGRIDPFYDPVPMRVWMCFALAAALAVGGGTSAVVYLLSPFLFATLIMFFNYDFGANL